MLQIAVLIQNSTLAALSEHSVKRLGGHVPLDERESLVLLDAEVLRRILDAAQPDDTRIDDVIKRLTL